MIGGRTQREPYDWTQAFCVKTYLLREVLHHVVALRLAVDQHVEPHLLLEADHALDLGAHAPVVGGLVDLSLPQLGSGPAELGGLGIGPDRRGREQGQVEAALGLAADLVRARTAGVVVAERRNPVAHRWIASPMRVAAVVERPVVGVELGGDRLATVAEPTRECHDLPHLLLRERHPRAQLVVQHLRWRLGIEVERRVQQGAGRGDDQLSAAIP
jgi:hypothetical protein